MTAVVAADLDQTLVYSRRAVARWGGSGAVAAVETHQGVDAGFMTARAAAMLVTLAERALVVPATTRTPEQLARIRIPGPPVRYAVAANGGVLLVDGVADATWARAVRGALSGCAPLTTVHAHAATVCLPQWTTFVRTACDLFCYAAVDREQLLQDFVASETRWAGERGWRVSLQGRKLYWVPASLTKSAAVAEVARRTAADTVFAAGDSLLDADLLESADRGIAARHGELVASGWRAPHVEITDGCGLAAGEQVVDWFTAAVR